MKYLKCRLVDGDEVYVDPVRVLAVEVFSSTECVVILGDRERHLIKASAEDTVAALEEVRG